MPHEADLYLPRFALSLAERDDRDAGPRTTYGNGISALKQFRRESRMNAQQFATFVGVSRKTIWSWFRPDDPVRNIKPEHVDLVRQRTGIDIGPRRRRNFRECAPAGRISGSGSRIAARGSTGSA